MATKVAILRHQTAVLQLTLLKTFVVENKSLGFERITGL